MKGTHEGRGEKKKTQKRESAWRDTTWRYPRKRDATNECMRECREFPSGIMAWHGGGLF
jgi:hypothetical protein